MFSSHLLSSVWDPWDVGESGHDLIPKTDQSLVWVLEQMEVLPKGQRPFKYHMDGKMERELSDNPS